jgi:hypothetical protein
MIGSRRRALRALAALALARSLPAAAQDAKSSVVQNAARDWLARVDALDAAGSWKAAGARYRTTMTEEGWAKALADARAEYGPVVQRSMLATTFQDHFDEGVQGDFALVLFRTSFEKRIDARETLTLEREADGSWRVIGYSIR